MLVAADTSQSEGDSRMMVIAPIKGGPADKAGVLPGDEVSTRDGICSVLHTARMVLLVLSCCCGLSLLRSSLV
jgi:C-terminal processing protease CtpA/Prc